MVINQHCLPDRRATEYYQLASKTNTPSKHVTKEHNKVLRSVSNSFFLKCEKERNSKQNERSWFRAENKKVTRGSTASSLNPKVDFIPI
jgi:hypothetical protein